MSTDNNINPDGDLLKPNIHNINLSFNNSSPKEELLNEDELDSIINSQKPIPAPVIPEIKEKEPEVQKEPELPKEPKEPEVQKMEIQIDFDVETMNTNLNSIATDAKLRINDLIVKQKKLDSRIGLIEKFILLDEKDLAVVITKDAPNYNRIGQIQKSITARTELLSQIMDISLKFEDSIHKWNKTLMEIEKDKVSAFQKIRSINKDVKTADNDINEVLNSVNELLASNKGLAKEAANELSLHGYGGKPFN